LGNRVCCFTGTPENVMGAFIPGRKTRIWMLPICLDVENDRFGAGAGADRGAGAVTFGGCGSPAGTVAGPGSTFGGVGFLPTSFSVSWRS